MGDELHTLSGAHAVHAVPDSDGVLFDAHMEGCPSCRTERRLRETAVLLALAVAEPPPAALRTRVLTAVARTPQTPRVRRAT